jgi:hypothetical protein
VRIGELATTKLQAPSALRLDATNLWRTGPRERSIVVAVLIGVAAVLTLSLLIPGRTYSGQHSFDMVVWLDGAYRAAAGQISSRDFVTPFGPLTYMLLGWAYMLSGSVGALMPINTALYALIFLPLLLYTCLSRLPWLVTIAFGCHLLILVVAPANIGDFYTIPTFAMFYNRFGWAILSLLTIMVLPRRGPGGARLDAVAMAALWATMFYTKISFAVVAIPLMLGFSMFGHLRHATLGAIILSAATLVIVDLFWGHTLTYLHEVAVTAAVSGPSRQGLHDLIFTVLRNAVGLELFAGVLWVALLRGVRLNYAVMALLIGGASVFVANQNSQGPGLPILISAALVVLLAPKDDGAAKDGLLSLGLLLTLALAIPGDAFALFVQARHTHTAAAAPAGSGVNVTLDGLMAPLDPQGATGDGPAREACAPYDKGGRDLLTAGYLPPLSPGHYLSTVRDGADLLGRNLRLRGPVYTLDFGNPFNAVLHRPPVTGGNQWNHFARNFNLTIHLAPDQAFGNAAVVMVPRRPAHPDSAVNMGKLYGPYIADHFILADRSMCWDAYVRRSEQQELGSERGSP